MKKLYTLCLFTILQSMAFSQNVNVTVNAQQGLTPISPWIYGKNNNTSDNSSSPVSASIWQMYNDAGLRFYRENGGNNCTKYNWRLKLSSHPDWYNNVYSHDWNYSAQTLLQKTKNTQGLYGLQLLGKSASNKNNNFNDWSYNQSQWWGGVVNNWAGGGGPTIGNGNPNLYLQNCTADSTVGILDYWFKNLKLDSTRLRYWNMDNEPEIWSDTHDDVAGNPTAEEYMQKYFAVAKAARKKFPGMKLVGPASPNEWQWYAWNNLKVTDPKDNKEYVWMEYFIKRIAEEQKASGIRLLDVLDVHFYPGTANDPSLTLQIHKLWFDTQWDYSNANGVKLTDPSGWGNSITKEYFFERCNQWLTNYIGSNHNVKFSISEYGDIANKGSENPNIIACWYASHLGTFANKGVEFFTPWDWYVGQWEVLHLFSNYYGQLAAGATSSNESVVGAYSSLTQDKDSLIIAIVNKDQSNAHNVSISLQNFTPGASSVNGYQLANLGSTETFVSKSNNALQHKTFSISGSNLTLSAPALSITMIQIPATVTDVQDYQVNIARIYPNPTKSKLFIEYPSQNEYQLSIQDIAGKVVKTQTLNGTSEIDISSLPSGSYILQMIENDKVITERIIKD